MEGIEQNYHRRFNAIKPIHNWHQTKAGRLVPTNITNKVLEFDQVDAEYESHDCFWSMEDVIVTCPSCGTLEAWAAYETPKDIEVHHTALCSTRYENELSR